MAETVRDPVCGMDIDPQNAVASMDYDGQRYYFCSQGCHDAFRADPEKYARQSSG